MMEISHFSHSRYITHSWHLQRYSEPSPALYKAAVLALLTDWVEEDYDTFVNGLQVFDSEPNVRILIRFDVRRLFLTLHCRFNGGFN